MEFEIKNTNYISTQGKEYVGVTLTKCVQELYEENYKTLKESKRNSIHGEIFHAMDRKIQYVKTSVLPNLIYRFSTIPHKIPASDFVDIDTLILKFIRRVKRPRITNMML